MEEVQDWASHLNHVQAILSEFDADGAPGESDLIRVGSAAILCLHTAPSVEVMHLSFVPCLICSASRDEPSEKAQAQNPKPPHSSRLENSETSDEKVWKEKKKQVFLEHERARKDSTPATGGNVPNTSQVART